MKQQPTMKMIISLEGTDKSYFLWNGTESYYKKFDMAYADLNKTKHSAYQYFGFFSLCASTLEYSLNFLLSDYCVYKFGHDKYRPYTEAYINLPFNKKLLLIPFILSDGKLIFDEKNSSFKNLNELISLRNKILHNKEFLQEFDFPKIDKQYKEKKISFQLKAGPNHIDTLTKSKCISFGKSLREFKNYVMTPGINEGLKENKMLIKLNTA
jgi:hypothetical protein